MASKPSDGRDEQGQYQASIRPVSGQHAHVSRENGEKWHPHKVVVLNPCARTWPWLKVQSQKPPVDNHDGFPSSESDLQ